MTEEIFPLVDEAGNVTGQAPRSVCHNGTKLLHPVIHLHLFNSAGQLFLQKRANTKDIQPGKWDSSVGGHIDLGETPEQAALREAREELGVAGIKLSYITKHIIETEVEKELTYCFFAVYDGVYSFDKKEVSDGRFWSIEEIESSLGKDIFTPNFELDFMTFLCKGLKSLQLKS